MFTIWEIINWCAAFLVCGCILGWGWHRRCNPHVHDWEDLGTYKGSLVQTTFGGDVKEYPGNIVKVYRCKTCGTVDRVCI